MTRPVSRPTLRLNTGDTPRSSSRDKNHPPAATAQPAVPGSPPLHQRDLQRVGGLPAVSALFQRDPQRVERLFFEPRMAAAVQDFCRILGAAKKPYRQVSPDELVKVGGSALHGGVVAVAHPKQALPLPGDQLAQWAGAGHHLVVLDGIGNPHNLGAIARSMAFFGFGHLLLSNHPAQAGLSGAAHRIAEGGLEWVDVYHCGFMPELIARLRPYYRIIGTALGGQNDPHHILSGDKNTKPVALLFGNEETGLPADTQAACDSIITIGGSGHIQSLNVSNSAAILLYELQSRFGRPAARAR